MAVQKLKFKKSKMAKSCHFQKRLKWYLCNRLTDFDEIWYGMHTGPHNPTGY